MLWYEESPIVHQNQSLDNSCQSASVAMLLNIPESVVVEEFHSLYRAGELKTSDYLKSKGAPVIIPDAEDPFLEVGYSYLLSVPSLNERGGLHGIVIYYAEDTSLCVFDPQYKKEGKLYYMGCDSEANANAVGLKNVIPLIKLPNSYIHSIYKKS